MTAPHREGGRLHGWVLVIVSIGIVGPGGYGFVNKFVQFVRTLNSEEGGQFTIVPIMNYLLVAAGFVCLLIWAIRHGMFKDIEAPKHTLLDREADLDAADRRHGGRPA